MELNKIVCDAGILGAGGAGFPTHVKINCKAEYVLANGAIEGAKSDGLLGAFTGGVIAGAGGIAAAVFFGYFAALIFKPKMKT